MSLPINYRISGRTDGPWLTLAHPIGASQLIWNGARRAFEDRFRVLTYDVRGHGDSPWTDGPCSLDELAGDVARLWTHLGIESSHFVGLSLGGCIGLALAHQVPERVDRLVVACSRLLMDDAAARMWRQRADAIEVDGMASTVASTLERWFTPAFRASQAAAMDAVAAELLRCDPAAFAACCRALATGHSEAHVRALRVRTLYLAGAQDTAVPPSHLEAYQRLTPGATFRSLPGPHLLPLENEAGFTECVRGFCGE